MKTACSRDGLGHTKAMKQPESQKHESNQKDNENSAIPTTPRKLGYVRVSDTDQSEALQIDALNAAGCAKLYRDHGLSGAKKHRPGLKRLLADLKEGDTLTVWKLDRLGRSTIHLLTILDDLRARGIHFHAITQGIDTTTALGRMLFGLLAVFAEYERSLNSERTKAGMQAAKERGIHVGRPRLSDTAEAALDQLKRIDCTPGLSDDDIDALIDNGAVFFETEFDA